LREEVPDSLIYSPHRSVSEFLDPGLWENWRLADGGAPPPPFLDTAPKDLLPQPLSTPGIMYDWIFWILFAGFAILTMTRFYHSKRLKLLGSSTLKRSAAIQLMRESPVYSHRSFLPLLSVYIISLILLIHQAMEITSPGSGSGLSSLLDFSLFLGIYLGFALMKILVIWLIGIIFKNPDTAREYIQNIIIYNLALGIILLPVLLLIIYTYHEAFLYLAGGIALIMMGLRFLRGIIIGLSDAKFSLIHLFLYLCTLEILPIAIAAKLMSKYFLA